MAQATSPVSIVVFKSVDCQPCKVVLRHLTRMVDSAPGTASLTIVDTDKHSSIAEQYNVRNVPHVLFNGEEVLSAKQAAGMLSQTHMSGQSVIDGSFGGMMGSGEGTMGMSFGFGGEQQDLFNHLFNQLIEAGIENFDLETWRKYSMMTISQKSISFGEESVIRQSVGDYVHIGVLQALMTSIIAIHPASRRYLAEAGNANGRYGPLQFHIMNCNPKIMETFSVRPKFREILTGIQRFSRDTQTYPIYLSGRIRTRKLSPLRAALIVPESAYAAGNTIGEKVCYMYAGEIQGLLEARF